MANLSEYLTEEKILVLDKVDIWETAVQKGADVLVKRGSIDNSYVKAMIESVYENGPYMVLADYFALMHARPSDGVNETDMSLLLLNEEADMEGNPIKIFLILAAKDNSTHIDALSEITTLLSDSEVFDLFLKADKEKILEIIKKEV